MAKIDKLYKSMGLPMNIKRGNPWPLDASSLWYSYDEMKAYAEDAAGVAYVGQILALVDETGNTAEAYIIADATGRLEPVGAGPLVDEKTIEIDTESNALMLKDFGKRFYKYVPEEKNPETGEVLIEASYRLVEVSDLYPWKAGLELRVASEDGEFVLGWYEPNPTTIEGVNNQIAGIQTTVSDLQQVVTGIDAELGNPAKGAEKATGIYAELEKKANAADVYNQAETEALIAEAVAAADHLQRKIVASYTDIQTFIDEKGAAEAAKYIFMVPEADSTADGNIYEEYMVIGGVIEVIGKWATDLSDYVTSESLEETLEGYVTTGALTTALTPYAKEADLNSLEGSVANLEAAIAGKVDKIEGHTLISQEDLDKLHNLSVSGEENYVKSVTADFAVSESGELSLNKDALDLSNNDDFKELSGNLATLEGNIGTINSNLTALETSIGTNASAIEALQGAQASMNQAVEKNKTDIANLVKTTDDLTSSLNDLSQSVGKNTGDIANIQAALNNYVLQSVYNKDIAEIRDILTWKTLEEPATE